jgi:phosphate/sulfate permease
MLRGRNGTSGVDWSQAAGIAKALLLSPLFGFVLAAILLYVLKAVLLRATPALFGEPKRQPAATAVDSRHPDPDLHPGQLLPWLQ